MNTYERERGIAPGSLIDHRPLYNPVGKPLYRRLYYGNTLTKRRVLVVDGDGNVEHDTKDCTHEADALNRVAHWLNGWMPEQREKALFEALPLTDPVKITPLTKLPA